MPRALVAFNWFGGKAGVVGKLLPFLDTPHQTYVEPFGGSAAVLLNKPPSPVEVYNDAYGDVVHFFKTLRDRRDELVEAIELTPYAREEFGLACAREGTDGVERARRFFVVARQVMMGLATTASPGRWCVAHRHSRRGMALVASRWLSAIDRLPEVVERLRTVVIEHGDWADVVPRYDHAETLYYLDPPYPMETRTGGRCYKYDTSDGLHEKVTDFALACKGKVVISSYANPLYDDRLAGWNRTAFVASSKTTNFYDGAPKERVEVVWRNF